MKLTPVSEDEARRVLGEMEGAQAPRTGAGAGAGMVPSDVPVTATAGGAIGRDPDLPPTQAPSGPDTDAAAFTTFEPVGTLDSLGLSDVSPDERYEAEPDREGIVRGFLGGTFQGVTESLGSAMRGTAAQSADYYRGLRPGIRDAMESTFGTDPDLRPEETPAWKGADFLRELSEPPETRETGASRMVGQVFGSLGTYAALGFASKGRMTPVGGFGALSGMGDFYEDAKREGASDEEAQAASVIGGVAGLTNVAPVSALFRGLEKTGGHYARNYLTGLATTSLSEAGQEAGYAWMRNLTARDWIGYDPDRDLSENVVEGAGAGGGAGAFMYSMARLLGARAPRPPRQAEIDRARKELAQEQGVSEDNITVPNPAEPMPWDPSFVLGEVDAGRGVESQYSNAEMAGRQLYGEATARSPEAFQPESQRQVEVEQAKEQRRQAYAEAFRNLESQQQQALGEDIRQYAEDRELAPSTAFAEYLDRDFSLREDLENIKTATPANPQMADAFRAGVSERITSEFERTGTLDFRDMQLMDALKAQQRASNKKAPLRLSNHAQKEHRLHIPDPLTDTQRTEFERLDFRYNTEPDTLTPEQIRRYDELASIEAGSREGLPTRLISYQERAQAWDQMSTQRGTGAVGRKADSTFRLKLKGEPLGKDAVRFSPDWSVTHESGLSVTQAREVATDLMRQWGADLDVRVVRRNRDLPADIRRQLGDTKVKGLAQRSTATGEFRGIWLVAKAHETRQELAETLAHEMAHAGLGRAFGPQVDGELMALWANHRRAVQDHADEIGIDVSTREGRLLAAEEWAATLAESEVNPTALQGLKNALQRTLDRSGVRVGEGDALNLIGEARRNVESGAPGRSYYTRWQSSRDINVPSSVRTHGLSSLGDHKVAQALEKNAINNAVARIDETLRQAGLENYLDPERIKTDADTYNRGIRLTHGLTHLAKKNQHIRPLQLYTELTRQWNVLRSMWTTRANDRLVEWEALGRERNPVISALHDQSIDGRWYTDSELEQMGLSSSAREVHSRIQEDFRDFLNQMEEAHIRALTRDPNLSQDAREVAVREARESFAEMRERPYFPMSRFGKYTVEVRAKEQVTWRGRTYEPGEVMWFSTYETMLKRLRQGEKDIPTFLKQSPKVGKSSKGYIDDTMQTLLSFPPRLRTMVESRMEATGQLSEQQREALNDLSKELAPTSSFANRMRRRENIEGFSLDGMRSYASYFQSGANFLARTMFEAPMGEMISDVRRSAQAAERQGGVNTTKRKRIAEWMERHREYLLNPGNELATLRAFGFNWYLGFMPRSAMVNLTQVPLITYPYLSSRYGDVATMRHISRAYNDVTQYYTRGEALSNDEIAGLERAVMEGFIDESMASMLAGVADGGNLEAMMSATETGRKIRKFSYYSSWMFTKAEQLNRRVTFLSAMRLARQRGMGYEEAYREARTAVEETQYEYARWNRPEYMRGVTSPVFLFYQYINNTAILMLGGDRSAGRAWMAYLLASGILGLPFVENILDLIDGAASKMFGKKVDTRLSMRQFLAKWMPVVRQELGEDFIPEVFESPDLIMRGLSRYAFGAFDLSHSLSMGRPIPGTNVLTPKGEMTAHEMWRAQEDVLGAVAGIPLSMMQATQADNPDTWKKLEIALPSILYSASAGTRRLMRGEETDWNGATVVEYDPHDFWHMYEIGGRFLGANPSRQTREQEVRRNQRQAARYWNSRRSMLLQQYDYVRRMGDQDDLTEFREKILDFNEEVPWAEMRLTRDAIRQSLQARERTRTQTELGQAPQRQYQRIWDDIRAAYPETDNPREGR